MSLCDISNESVVPSSSRSTNVNLCLPIKFSPTKKNDENASQPASVRRSRGETNVDLWVDGGLYPKDLLVADVPYTPKLNQICGRRRAWSSWIL